MRKLTRTTLAATAVVGLLAVPVAGAGAAGTSDTTVTFTVDAAASSALAIAQASGTASLDDGAAANPVFNPDGTSSATGNLPATTVEDKRGELLGTWSVSVVANGPWINQSDGSQTVAASNARAYFDLADADALELSSTLLGGMAVTGGEFAVTDPVNPKDLSSSYQLVAGETALGDGTITYTPRIDITVPAGTPQGVYSAIVTQTLS